MLKVQDNFQFLILLVELNPWHWSKKVHWLCWGRRCKSMWNRSSLSLPLVTPPPQSTQCLNPTTTGHHVCTLVCSLFWYFLENWEVVERMIWLMMHEQSWYKHCLMRDDHHQDQMCSQVGHTGWDCVGDVVNHGDWRAAGDWVWWSLVSGQLGPWHHLPVTDDSHSVISVKTRLLHCSQSHSFIKIQFHQSHLYCYTVSVVCHHWFIEN